MHPITYKTNIGTEEALCKITPALNQLAGPANWRFDAGSREKKLTVLAHSFVDEDKVVRAILRAGFQAENLDDYYSIF